MFLQINMTHILEYANKVNNEAMKINLNRVVYCLTMQPTKYVTEIEEATKELYEQEIAGELEKKEKQANESGDELGAYRGNVL